MAIAPVAAWVAIALKDSDAVASRRERIPVLDVTHSSDVSTRQLSVWLSKEVAGVAEPLPVIATPKFCKIILHRLQQRVLSFDS
jgi:hypothetical protein